MRKFTLLTLFVLVFALSSWAQTTYYYNGSGNITSTTSWGVNIDGSGTNPANFTAIDQIFVIQNAISPVLNANWVVSGTGSKIVVGDGVNPINFSTSTFTITGTVDVSNLAQFTVQSNSAFTVGTMASGSTVDYAMDGTQSVRAGVYHHLALSNASVARTKSANGNITVNGGLGVASNNILALGANVLDGTLSGVIFGNGIITTTNTSANPLPDGKTWTQEVQYNGTTSHALPNGTYENLTIGGSSDTKTANGNIVVNGVLNVVSTNILALATNTLTGSFTLTGTGTISTTNTTATPLPSGKTWTQTVSYAAAGTQTIVDGTYQNLTIAGGGSNVKSPTTNLVVLGTVTVNTSTILDMVTFDLSATTITNSGTIRTQSTSATPIPSGKTIGGTFLYNSSSPQTVVAGTYAALNVSGGNRTYSSADSIRITSTWTMGSGTQDFTGTSIALRGTTQTITITGQTALAFNNLSVSVAGTKTFSNAGADITVNGNLNIPGTTSSFTLAMGTNRLLLGGGYTFSGNGTLATACVLSTPLPSIGGAWQFIINYNSASTQFIAAGTYGKLYITGNGTSTAEGNLVVNDSLAVTAGTLALTTNTLSGTITSGIGGAATAIISTTNTSATPIPTGRVWPVTIVYAAAVNQTIVDGTYSSAVQITGGASAIKTVTANFAVGTTLTVAASTILDLSTFTMTATTIANSGTIRTQNTSVAPIPEGKTYAGTVEYNSGSHQTVVYATYTNLNLTGGDRTLSSTNIIKVSGTLTLGSGAFNTFNSTVELNGTTQSIVSGGQTLYNLAITAGTTKTVSGGNLGVDNDLYILPTATLAMTTFDLIGSLTLLTGSGTITTTSTSANPIPSSRTWPYTVNFSSAVADQTVPVGTYTNLTLSGAASRVKTAASDLTVTGILNVAATTIFDMSTHQLSGVTSVTGTGTLRTQNTSVTPIPTGTTWTCSVTYNSASPQTVVYGSYNSALNVAGGDRTFSTGGSINVTGTFTANTGTAVYTTTGSTLTFNSAAAQTLTLAANFPFDVVSFTGGNTKTIGVAVLVNTSINIASGVTVNIGTNALTGATLTTTGTGLLRTQNTSATPIPTGRTWSFRVQFDVTNNNQTIPTGTYNGGLYMSATSGSRTRTLAGDITVADTLSVGSTFTTLVLNNNTLTINGIINPAQTGTITGSLTSSIVVGSNTEDAGTLRMTQTSNTTRSLLQLTLSRASGADALILGNELRLIGVLTVSDGTLASNGNLVFVSTAGIISAQIAPVTGTGNVSGNVVVQRFIDGQPIATNVRWRFLASSVNTSTGIDDNWQQQIYITGPGAGGTFCPTLTPNANGFDATKDKSPSFYVRDLSTDTWISIPNTNATELQTGIGYRVFYRGSRNQSCVNVFSATPPTPDDTTLVATGTLAIGTQVLTGASVASRYALVGNPFQATIDLESPGITLTNLSTTFSCFRPNSVNGSYGYYTLGGVGVNGMTQYITPGQSFWIQTLASGASNMSIAESAKSPFQGGFGFFKTSNAEQNVLRIKLYTPTNTEYLDEVAVVQRPNASWAYSASEDALKLTYTNDQLQLVIPGYSQKQAICFVPDVDATHNRINIEAKTVMGNDYSLNFSGVTSFDASMGFVLYDTYTGATQDLRISSIYSFTTPDIASTSSSRFYIILNPNASPLPVKLTSFVAHAVSNDDVELVWQTASEQQSEKFVVERSVDGKTFTTVGEVAAAGNSRKPRNYSLTDGDIKVNGTIYYRLKQVDFGGKFNYSTVVAVQLGQVQQTLAVSDISLYPVPADNSFTIAVKDAGLLINPEVRFYDMFGKEIVLPQSYESGKWTVQTEGLTAGMYVISINNQGETTQVRFVKR